MTDAIRHLAKAQASLEAARYLLDGDFNEEAGRTAYMAAYHAAQAFIVDRTATAPKTHRGTRSEFSRLARDEPRIQRDQVSLIGWSYELKTAADYDQEHRVSRADAERALVGAKWLVDTITAILTPA